MVIVSHAFRANSEAGGAAGRLLGNVVGYGLFGVDLFFVLSGFLITGILVDSVEGDGYFSKFYARRTLRIFPLYYGVLLVVFLLTPLLHLHWEGMGWLLLGYLQNIRPEQIVTFTPGAGIALNHFWSLAIEEQFYLVWPAIIFMVRDRRRLLQVTMAGAVGALVLRLVLLHWGATAAAIHVGALTRADSLLLGGSLALLYRTRHWGRVTKLAPWGFAAAAAVVVLSIVHFGGDFAGIPFSPAKRLWVSGPRYTFLALGSACLIAWSLEFGSSCGWLFQRKWLMFFGKYSYGIYVLHMLALSPILTVLRRVIFEATNSKLLGVAGAGVLELGLSVAAAVVCFRIYEKPILGLKAYFSYAYAPKAAMRPIGVEASVGRSPVMEVPVLDVPIIEAPARVREESLVNS